jgi:hypothetical protein
MFHNSSRDLLPFPHSVLSDMYYISISLIVPIVSFVPTRTHQRDLLFFGVDSTPPAVVNDGTIRLVPASSIVGVLSGPVSPDTYDYGSGGVPPAVAEGRQPGKFSLVSLIETDGDGGLDGVREILNLISNLLLILFSFLFIYIILNFGNINSNNIKLFKSTNKEKMSNMRIDREAYVYVEGG